MARLDEKSNGEIYLMEELKIFLKEHKIDNYLFDTKIQIFIEPALPSHIFITLINILTYNFKDVKFSVPFTYGNPYLLITWNGIK